MPKILMCLAILVCATTVESRPSSDIEKVPCIGCSPLKIINRAKRSVEDIIGSISGLVGNILHENWTHIERIRAMRYNNRNIFIGNGHDNYNRVTIHSNPNDGYYY